MVDSRPIAVGPASRMTATASPRSAATWAAVVGLTWPERLALGAASGRPKAASSAWATGWAGTRMRDRVEAGGDEVGDRRVRPLRQDERQRARPEGVGEALAHRRRRRAIAARRGERGDVDDQRVEARPALGDEDRADGARVAGVGGEAVDRLGRHGDELAAPQRRDAPWQSPCRARAGAAGIADARQICSALPHRVRSARDSSAASSGRHGSGFEARPAATSRARLRRKAKADDKWVALARYFAETMAGRNRESTVSGSNRADRASGGERRLGGGSAGMIDHVISEVADGVQTIRFDRSRRRTR